MSTGAHLQITINNRNPIELLDLTKSLAAFSNQFQKFITKSEKPVIGGEAVLYVHEIKTGSIIVQLQELFTQSVLPFAENTTIMLDFALYLKMGINYFLKKEPTTYPMSVEEYKDFSAIVEPIAKDNASQLNISTVVNGNVELHFHINSTESNAVQNIIKHEMKALRMPVEDGEGILKRQTLTFYQARNDPKSKQGNKGTIEDITDKHLNISFTSDEIMTEMLHGETNPLDTAYVVDVSIENIKGKPAIYKIHKFHEYFDLTDSD